MKALKVLFGLVLMLVALNAEVYAQVSPAASTLKRDRNTVESRNYQVTYRNGASADTTQRMFTGAANLADTSREVFPIWGASTISLEDIYTISQDSALVLVYLEVSNDGTSFYSINPVTILGGSAFGNSVAQDSSGSANTGQSPFTRVINISSPPTWARFCRVIAVKRLSASTDTVKVQTFLHVTFNDE